MELLSIESKCFQDSILLEVVQCGSEDLVHKKRDCEMQMSVEI